MGATLTVPAITTAVTVIPMGTAKMMDTGITEKEVII
jgi:hypothetical protein